MKLSKCFLASLLIILARANCVHAEQAITACAIRWDAWYSNGASDPAHYTAAALSPPRWHSLAPLHASFDSSGNISWNVSQEIIDAEIRAAHGAKLCWAYVMYGANDAIDLNHPMMTALRLHRLSQIKSEVHYALITSTSLLGEAGHYDEAVKRTIELLHDTNYQQFSAANHAQRPLLFINFDTSDLDRRFGGSLSKLKEAIDALRRNCRAEHIGDPYIVLLFSPSAKAEPIRAALGADAISQYVAGRRKGIPQSWADFEPSIEDDWNSFATATAGGAVPTVRSGADIRPRCETPPPFEHRFKKGVPCDNFVALPSASELKSEFSHAVQWIDRNPLKDPGRLLLIYSWSECDESGNCLMPTVGDPTGKKLQAISSVLP